MVVSLICGYRGDGKTTLCTLLLYNAFTRGRKVLANYSLHFEFEKLKMSRLMDNIDEYGGSILAVDEAYMYVDSRNFSSKFNKAFGYLMLQTRKRGIDIVLTVHQKQMADVRLRLNLDYVYECESMVRRDHVLFRATIEEMEAGSVDMIHVWRACQRDGSLVEYLFDPKPYFELFDTKEFIEIM